ncbi:uncharacterized protein L201_003861 [Kwoniella dendrophila CBS 6074]|uniref:Expansin-like EG45 domain-containing protein n=1 Tax=Kwoniella dendrophila CBS 6074 TaxID=1295534 RepID=A0AAX4JU26_9TREE
MLSMGLPLAFGIFAFLAGQVTKAANFSMDGARGTVQVFQFISTCAVDGSDFSGAGPGDSLGACGYSAAGLATSRIVAVAGGVFDKSMCGQEVTITQNGKPLTFSEGPLYVGDMCPGCEGGSVLDISAKAAFELMDGNCRNPPSFAYQITNNVVGPRLVGGGGSTDSVPAISSAGTAPASSVMSIPGNAVPSVTSPAAQPVIPSAQVNSPTTSDTAIPSVPSVSADTAAEDVPAVFSTSVVGVPAAVEKNSWGGPGGAAALFAEDNTVTEQASCKRRRKRRSDFE